MEVEPIRAKKEREEPKMPKFLLAEKGKTKDREGLVREIENKCSEI